MATSVKAIETIYRGYRFRSRLEARWAIFFDAMGEPWEYEKEGFDLKGVRYLPDFWLPRFEFGENRDYYREPRQESRPDNGEVF